MGSTTTIKKCISFLFFLSYFTVGEMSLELGVYIERTVSEELPKNCTDVLDAFAKSASDLTKCSIQYARPIKLCEKCVEQYVDFYQNYNKLVLTHDNATSCRSLLISRDRLDAVLHFYENIEDIWEQGHCNSCFNWSSVNDLPTSAMIEPSDSTKHFNKLHNDTMICISTNTKLLNNSEEVCNKCMQFYINLDEYYKSLSPDRIGVDSICMDIVDSMNATRFLWSKKLNCCHLRQTPEIIFLFCTGIISALPILFYLSVRFCGPIRDLPKVLRQSRFNQHFLTSTNTNIN